MVKSSLLLSLKERRRFFSEEKKQKTFAPRFPDVRDFNWLDV
jgi:hypothetical protein